MNVILATRNPSKAKQINGLFEGSPVLLQSLDDVGVVGDAVEDGTTLNENAMKKVLFAYKALGGNAWVMADDTGFFISALHGAPGIYAARWAGETATTKEITDHTLHALIGASDRSAKFETVVAIMSPDGQEYFFSGAVEGHILEAERVPPQPKMPYSGIFMPNASDLVWAQMSVEFENTISHRGIAFGKAREFLEAQMQQGR